MLWSHIINLYVHYLNIIASYTSIEIFNTNFITLWLILYITIILCEHMGFIWPLFVFLKHPTLEIRKTGVLDSFCCKKNPSSRLPQDTCNCCNFSYSCELHDFDQRIILLHMNNCLYTIVYFYPVSKFGALINHPRGSPSKGGLRNSR